MKEILFDKEDSIYLKSILRLQRAELVLDFEKNKKEISLCDKLIKKIERAERKIKTSSAKGKGRNLQYWVCERIAEMFGIKFVQSDDTCLVHSRTMGLNGTDVVLTGELVEKFPFAVECKACETLSIPEWIRQARNNEKENQNYLLVFKKQSIGGQPVVLMDWSTFENIFKCTLK